MFSDFILFSVSYLSAWLILMRRVSLVEFYETMVVSYIFFVIIFFITFLIFGMYGSLWRYAEAHEFLKCMLASFFAAIIFFSLTWIIFQPPRVDARIPLTVYFLSFILASMGPLFLRMAYRAYRTTRLGKRTTSNMKKVMVVGAGETGSAVIQGFYREENRRHDVICVVDDDPAKQGRNIQRVKVAGTTNDIPKLIDKHGIHEIILAIPSASSKDKRRISSICAKTNCHLKKVPDIFNYDTDINNDIMSKIQDVSIEDLLSRDEVEINPNKSKYLTEKIILVTGAGGSIGSELCRQIIMQGAQKLVMVDICENGLYDIQQELLHKHGRHIQLFAEVASVREEAKLNIIFDRYKPEIVYHAAAHKHVPLMEYAPEEAVKNNVFGTLNTARCADKNGVKRFVMISTDKAVNPTSVMGATKRVCEMIIQSMNQISKTDFVAVRFGNVLGSNGSVIPLFKAQIAAGGPVTVMHKDIIRYFMTISEAVSLVMTAGEMAKGGEIFVLDMGEQVKILELAETLIRLSGFEPYKEINIIFTGLRPGEKLYEELLMDEEGLKKTSNNKIFVGKQIDIELNYLFDSLNKLKPIAETNEVLEILKTLHELVPGFNEAEERAAV
jgi:FlaA1/EpsC-like NDP-sugar epimerase